MPLIKSKSGKAFEHNIKAEMDAGKPQNQALAIAYSMKRQAGKKYANGGQVGKSERMRRLQDMFSYNMNQAENYSEDQMMDQLPDEDFLSDEDDGEMGEPMADGGMVSEDPKMKRRMRIHTILSGMPKKSMK